MFCGFIYGSRSTRARWIKWRGQTWRACRFAHELVRIRRHVPERVSANCYFWIGKLDSFRGGLAEGESESERLRLSDSAMWIVRLWVGWRGRLLAPSDSAGRRTAGIPADQILQRRR